MRMSFSNPSCYRSSRWILGRRKQLTNTQKTSNGCKNDTNILAKQFSNTNLCILTSKVGILCGRWNAVKSADNEWIESNRIQSNPIQRQRPPQQKHEKKIAMWYLGTGITEEHPPTTVPSTSWYLGPCPTYFIFLIFIQKIQDVWKLSLCALWVCVPVIKKEVEI